MTQFFSLIRPAVGYLRILICLVICVSVARSGQAQTFEIDNDHTSLVFAVSHAGLSYTYGRFNNCSGQIIVSKDVDQRSFVFTIDADSIDTNNQLRDDHLKGPDFFDVQAFPKIEFRSIDLKNEGDVYTVQGALSLHGVERDVTIEMTKIGLGRGPRGKARIGFFSKFSVKRSDYGIKSLPTVIGNEIAITLSFEGILKPKKGAEAGLGVDEDVKKVDDVEGNMDRDAKGSLESDIEGIFGGGGSGEVKQSGGLQEEFRILEP